MLSPADIWRRLQGTEPPGFVGRRSGPLLILGGGRCVWDDWKAATIAVKNRPRVFNGDVMAVNDIGQYLHGMLHHWFTLHPEYMPGWLTFRMGHLYGEGTRPTTHSHKGAPEIDRIWPGAVVGGTSGLAAPLVGLMIGYAPILLAGMPMDASGHFFDPPGEADHGLTEWHVQEAWRAAQRDFFGGRVKSFSGNTREWLGDARDFLKAAA